MKIYSLWFFTFTLLFSCGSDKKNKSKLDISLKEGNTLWLENDTLCSKELHSCRREFWMKKATEDNFPKELASFSKAWFEQEMRGRLYVFTPSEHSENLWYVLPALPTELDQKNFENWFSNNIFPSLLKNPIFRNKESVEKHKNSWLFQDVQLLDTKCTLSIYPKVIEYPFIFVFVWKSLPKELKFSYTKVEKWSLEQFKATLSTDINFADEQNI